MNLRDYFVEVEISNGRRRMTREVFVSAAGETSAVKEAFRQILAEDNGVIVSLKKKRVYRAVETIKIYAHNWFC